MTLDEAIIHCEEVADGHDRIKQIKAVTLEECKCAYEHRQLAEWLRELKAYKEQTDGDLISRQAVLDIISDVMPIYSDNYHYILEQRVKDLPSAEKTAEWRIVGKTTLHYECSKCGGAGDEWDKFCKHCGRRMKGNKEDGKTN